MVAVIFCRMKAVLLSKFGGYENIQVSEVPCPDSCGKFEVVVHVHYCGVNFADVYLRKGLIPTLKTPHVLGLECIGVIKMIGTSVSSVKEGQRVLCYNGSGGMYCEEVIVPEQNCFAVPDDISDESAVCLPANFLTAYFCLFSIANVRPHHTILIHSCGGGVGWAATQLAKTIPDVTVIGTASEGKHELVKRNGVDYVLDSANYYCELIASDLSYQSFDIILDSLGGSNVAVSESLLRPLGKLVLIGGNSFIQGDEKLGIFDMFKLWWNTKDVSLHQLIMKNSCIAGLNLDQMMKSDPAAVHQAMDRIFALIQDKKISPRIDSIIPFEKAVDAMKRLSTRKNVGKVLLKI